MLVNASTLGKRRRQRKRANRKVEDLVSASSKKCGIKSFPANFPQFCFHNFFFLQDLKRKLKRNPLCRGVLSSYKLKQYLEDDDRKRIKVEICPWLLKHTNK